MKPRPLLLSTLTLTSVLPLCVPAPLFAKPAKPISKTARPTRKVGAPLQLRNKIVWVHREKVGEALYQMHPDGTRQTRLTTLKGANPAISPDGRRIAFESNHQLLGKGEMFAWHMNVWVMQSDGMGLKQVADYDSESPAFSPDGRKIAFMQGGRDPHGPSHDFDIIVKEIGRAKTRNLTVDRKNNDTQPVFRPNSKKIVFASGQWKPDPDGGNGDEESRNIFLINVDGTERKQLTTSAQDDSDPTFSPDGRNVAFVRGRYVFNGEFYRESQIYIMNADGTQQRMLTSIGKNNFAPTFSPDGKQLAFVSDRDGNKEIYVMNADGSNQKRLTNNLVDDTSPIWR
ncbi:MAG TPA: hypothetical protein VF600_11165 [Abditibacteriaceae bacterium]|jgi:TolB protein